MGDACMKLRTSYAGHETAYKRRKQQGYSGWDRSPESYDQFRDLIEKTLSKGTAPTTGRLLEIGCGAGNMALWLAEKGYEVYGVDISPTAIQWTRERAKAKAVHADFAIGDVRDLECYEDAFFDFVLDGHCLHCIIGEDRPALLNSVLRVLKPGAYFLVSTMCSASHSVTLEGFDPESRCTICGGIASRYIGMPDDIVREIERSGFRIADHHVEFDEPVCELVVEALKPGLSD
jgi:ubiquinone/menaquinone biosynthesis C-methylase UbiE